MANDTSKLTINNKTYDIKDANARCSKYQYTLNKNNWSNNTYALSVSASNIDCKCYNTIELSNYYDINQWKTYGISIDSTDKSYDGATDTTTLATIYFKCETVPGSNLTFTIASFPSKTSVNGDLVNPYNDNDYTNADKALVQNSPITTASTGSDLTLSTSSGNVNALTVYGKSEVVDGDIVSAGEDGSIEIETCQKNLLDPTKLVTENITYTDGVLSGTASAFYNAYSLGTPILFNKSRQITFSVKAYTSGSINAGRGLLVHFVYKDNTRDELEMLNNTTTSQFFTLTSNPTKQLQYIGITFGSEGTNMWHLSEIQLEYGASATTYEPYNGTMAVFSTGTPLRGIPDTDVRDVMTWNGSTGTVTKNCEGLNLGSLTWAVYSKSTTGTDGSKAFIHILDKPAKSVSSGSSIFPAMSNYKLDSYYNTVSFAEGSAGSNALCQNINGTAILIRVAAINTVEDLQTYISNNPITLIYELAVPTTEQLSSTENASIAGLRTFTPTTHVQNNAGAEMTIEAYAGTANGRAVNAIDINKETKSVTLSYADYVALQNKDPETSYYCPDAPDTWIFGYDLDKDDENPFTRVSYPADVDNTFYTPAFMDYTADKFNYGSWNFKPGEKFMPNPCMLLYNGTVGYYLDPDDNTKKADGTASDVADTSYGGNAMMEWGLLYTKRWEENGVYKFRVSNVRIDADWECWCNYDINNNVIPHFYTPIYFGSYDGTRMRSLSGQSNMVSTTAQQEIDRAKANGSDIWYTEVTSDQKLIEDLAVLMCKSTAIQEKYGTGRVSAGSAIAPGTMNTKGMFWGDNGGTNGVKIFGMENPYGNICRRRAGYTYNVGVQNIKLTRGTHDGSTATDYNITGDGYISISNSIITGSSGGYITEMITTPFGRFPKVLGGSQTTFEADACWHNDTYNGCYAQVGGHWYNGRLCGLFYVRLDNAPSYTSSAFGASLSCKPLA